MEIWQDLPEVTFKLKLGGTVGDLSRKKVRERLFLAGEI